MLVEMAGIIRYGTQWRRRITEFLLFNGLQRAQFRNDI
jgi:hypothetical protein